MTQSNKEKVVSDEALAPYWEAAEAGRLLLSSCRSCRKTYYYPRPICPFCMSTETEWREASGEGSIYSWSVERRADPPYAIAFVTLAEGPTILTNIVDTDFEQVKIGAAVRLQFETREEMPVPVFTLA